MRRVRVDDALRAACRLAGIPFRGVRRYKWIYARGVCGVLETPYPYERPWEMSFGSHGKSIVVRLERLSDRETFWRFYYF